MTLQEYTDKLKQDFAFYGFTETPLTDEQIEHLFDSGFSAPLSHWLKYPEGRAKAQGQTAR